MIKQSPSDWIKAWYIEQEQLRRVRKGQQVLLQIQWAILVKTTLDPAWSVGSLRFFQKFSLICTQIKKEYFLVLLPFSSSPIEVLLWHDSLGMSGSSACVCTLPDWKGFGVLMNRIQKQILFEACAKTSTHPFTEIPSLSCFIGVGHHQCQT